MRKPKPPPGTSEGRTLPPAVARAAEAKDWPTYNHDVLGTRHNPGETAIGKANAGRLREKWRFPAHKKRRHRCII